MKRILLSLGLLSAFAVQASAVLDLQLFPVPGSPAGTSANNFVLPIGGTQAIYGAVVGVDGKVTSFSFAPTTGFTFSASAAFANYASPTGPGGNFGSAASPQFLGTITAIGPRGVYTNVLSVQDPTAPNASSPTGFGQTDGENISVQVTPEPASFAALGVGAVALLRRRRKA